MAIHLREGSRLPAPHPALGQQSPDQSPPPEEAGAADRRHPRGAATQPLPVSQRGPSKGSAHRQVKFPTRSTHEPPFRQGSELHSSTSAGGRGGHSAPHQPLTTLHPAPLAPCPPTPPHPPTLPRPTAGRGHAHLSRRPPLCSRSGTRKPQGRPPPGTSRHSDTLCHRMETVLWAHSV